jgi:hypothetical protein
MQHCSPLTHRQRSTLNVMWHITPPRTAANALRHLLPNIDSSITQSLPNQPSIMDSLFKACPSLPPLAVADCTMAVAHRCSGTGMASLFHMAEVLLPL